MADKRELQQSSLVLVGGIFGLAVAGIVLFLLSGRVGRVACGFPSSGSGQGEVFINGKWMVNLNGLYQLPWQLELAANVYGKQGTPIPPVAPASLGLDGSHNVLLVSEVDDLRLDNVWNVDLRLAKNFLMGRSNINLTADLFNVFNNNVELQRNRVVGGTFNQLNQNLSPRILRFGVRIGF